MNTNDTEKQLVNELLALKKILNAKEICLELIRPKSKPDQWIVSDTDINCFGTAYNGDAVFEFNFNTSLKNFLTMFVNNKSISTGVRFWLTPNCELGNEEISKESLEAERKQLFDQLQKKYKETLDQYRKTVSSQPFGRDLASAVFSQLKAEPLCYLHRDYCGTGLFRKGDRVDYSEFEDGHSIEPSIASFENEMSFVDWLSIQSDQSLARLDCEEFKQGNQTISKNRLVAFTSQS